MTRGGKIIADKADIHQGTLRRRSGAGLGGCDAADGSSIRELRSAATENADQIQGGRRMPSSSGLTRRAFGKAAATVATGAMATSFGVNTSRAQSNTLVFASFGGSIITSQRAFYLNAFEKETGIKVIDVPDVSMAKLKTMADAGNAEWDLAQSIGLWLPQKAADGRSVWTALDYSQLTTDGIPDFMKTEFGVSNLAFAVTFAYNTKSFKPGQGPSNWAEFFDVKKFPGKRGLYNSPRDTFEAALLSDGVRKENLYPLDADRALKRLGQIKDQIVWWDRYPQGANLLASGEFVASITAQSSVRQLLADDPSTPIFQVWDGPGIMTLDYLSIPRGAKNKAGAVKLINYMLDPKRQAMFSKETHMGPSNEKALAMLDKKTLEALPSYYYQQGALVPRDELYWVDNIVPLTERFNAWKLGK
jgi:putative spermidine/putrescine transport system substrate-binding protein